MKFPKIQFVRIVKEEDGSTYSLCHDHISDAVEDDGPTMVGTYQLIAVDKVSKIVQLERAKNAKTKGRKN